MAEFEHGGAQQSEEHDYEYQRTQANVDAPRAWLYALVDDGAHPVETNEGAGKAQVAGVREVVFLDPVQPQVAIIEAEESIVDEHTPLVRQSVLRK